MRIEELYQRFLNFPRVVKDTRENVKDSIYFSLKGGNFNGNAYAKDALEKGAAYAVIDEPKYKVDDRMLLVDDVLLCLQDLARHHRVQLGLPIIALTGSNGKTTTKELIHSVLSKKYKCKSTGGNFNNHIGVPLTLLSMDKTTEIGVVEMGANNPGEIDELCQIALPDYGYITNFGRVHLEGFGDLNGVIQAKTEMYRHLEKKSKMVFINKSDSVQLDRSRSLERILIGDQDSGCGTQMLGAEPYVRMKFKGMEIQSQLIGAYNYPNMAAAACIGSFFEVPIEQIKAAIESYVPENNRSQIIIKGSNTIIMDAYNANPNSMEAALSNLNGLSASKKVAILGDMFEIGKESFNEHQHIADLASSSPFERIYLIGENFSEVKLNEKRTQSFSSFEDFAKHFAKQEFSQTTFLIKGSRGMALERVLEIF